MFKLIGQLTADLVSDLVGYAAVVDWAPSAQKGETLLDIPAYTQIDSYSCGAVSGFQVVKAFYPDTEFVDFYQEVNPHQDTGTSINRMRRALNKFGISVQICKRLTSRKLRQAIDDCHPVLLTVRNPGSQHYHWVVAHGFSDKHVVLAGNGLPVFHRRRFAWREFDRLWLPRGNGLICS